MQRCGLGIGILLLTFVCGVAASGRLSYFRDLYGPQVQCRLQVGPMPFVSEGSLLETDYHIYRYRLPDSENPEQITLYGGFRSAQVTRELFESNATSSASTLIESNIKYVNRHAIGPRGVTVSKYGESVRIFWIDGDVFWCIQAPSFEIAHGFESSEIVKSITTSNKRLERTRR